MDINYTPAVNYSDDEAWLNSLITSNIITNSLPKDNKHLTYNTSEYIYFLKPVWVYQLPIINNNSSSSTLTKFVHTFKKLNPDKDFKDLTLFLKHTICENKLAELSTIYNSVTAIDKKQLFTTQRHVIFNNKLIISNHNFTNAQKKEYMHYKKQLQGKAILDRNLALFSDVYRYSNKTLTGIKKDYLKRNLSIKPTTIKRYAAALNLELLNNTRININYDAYIKQLLMTSRQVIYHRHLLALINSKEEHKITLHTVREHLTDEHKRLIAEHNASFKKVKEIDYKPLIANYYNEHLRKEFIVKYTQLLALQAYIKEVTNKDVTLEVLKYNIRKTNSKAKIQRTDYGARQFMKLEKKHS